jgi:copper chaperone CopZ
MITTQHFSIQHMHCTGCAASIDLDLEEMAGIISVSTSYPKAETTVVYDSEKISQEDIVRAIQTTGYTQNQTIQSSNKRLIIHASSGVSLLLQRKILQSSE